MRIRLPKPIKKLPKKIRLRLRKIEHEVEKSLSLNFSEEPKQEEKPKSAKLPKKLLNSDNFDAKLQVPLQELVARIISLAQVLAERKFYDYQIDLSSRVIESVLLHDGSAITGLMARQMGKTDVVSATVAAMVVIFPILAKQFPEDWHLNITDSEGVYRGFMHGLLVGIYAPKMEQSEIMFNRVQKYLTTDTAKEVLGELKVTFEEHNGNTVRLSNGSRVLCQSASEQSKIEGATHHLLILEEAQDISDRKINKSLRPMVSSTMGTILMVGTASTKRCVFYTMARANEREESFSGIRNHFVFPYTVGMRYNSLYGAYVEKERNRLGEDSDEFRTSYLTEWVFERGMFITAPQLFNSEIAQSNGYFSERCIQGINARLRYYSEVVGIDFGQAHDSTVVTVMAVDWRNPIETGSYYDADGNHEFVLYRKHVVDWFEMQGDNYEAQFWKMIEYFQKRPKLEKIVCDSNACGKPIFDRLKSHFQGKVTVEPFNFQPQVKSNGYKTLAADLSGHRVTFPAGPISRNSREYRRFISQMLDLRKDYSKGVMSVSHPDDKNAHDDYPDSFMLANWGCNTPAFGSSLDFSENNVFFR